MKKNFNPLLPKEKKKHGLTNKTWEEVTGSVFQWARNNPEVGAEVAKLAEKYAKMFKCDGNRKFKAITGLYFAAKELKVSGVTQRILANTFDTTEITIRIWNKKFIDGRYLCH